jgi:hypothetical protein
MPSKDATVRSVTSQIGAAKKHHPKANIGPLYRDLRAARLSELIRKEAAADPPLTTEQRVKLAGLLLGGGAG